MIIQFDRDDVFKVGDEIVASASPETFLVVKVYRLNWWRKIFRYLGFKVTYHAVKVVSYGGDANY